MDGTAGNVALSMYLSFLKEERISSGVPRARAASYSKCRPGAIANFTSGAK
jgi:hypothetical protein